MPSSANGPVAVIDGDPSLSLATPLADGISSPDFQRPTALLPLPDELKNGGIKISRRQLQQCVAQRLSGIRNRPKAAGRMAAGLFQPQRLGDAGAVVRCTLR